MLVMLPVTIQCANSCIVVNALHFWYILFSNASVNSFGDMVYIREKQKICHIGDLFNLIPGLLLQHNVESVGCMLLCISSYVSK